MDIPETVIEITPWDDLPEDIRNTWSKRISEVLPPPLLTEFGAHSLTLQDFDPRDLAALVSKDAVLASKVLAVANSAKYGLTTPLTSVQRAIMHLGFNLVKTIMVAYQLESSFDHLANIPKSHLDYIRRWSAGSSIVAMYWAQAADMPDPSTASTVSLLSRLGTMMLGLGEPAPGDAYRQQPDQVARYQHEQATWQLATPALSCALVRQWGLPELLPEMLALIWEPLVKEYLEQDNAKTLTLICATDVLVQRYLHDPAAEPEKVLAEAAYAVLKANLEKHNLINPLNWTWGGLRLQRDLSSAAGAEAGD